MNKTIDSLQRVINGTTRRQLFVLIAVLASAVAFGFLGYVRFHFSSEFWLIFSWILPIGFIFLRGAGLFRLRRKGFNPSSPQALELLRLRARTQSSLWAYVIVALVIWLLLYSW